MAGAATRFPHAFAVKTRDVNIDVEVAIVGAGFGGIGMAMQLDRSGRRSWAMLERDRDVGGIWRDNVYPGCACDIPSMLYSFSFERGTDWTRHYPQQSEIWQYLRDLVERRGLRDRIAFGWELTSARYDDGEACWQLTAADGRTLVARALVLATGALNVPKLPPIAGIERFEGTVMHSSRWDPSVEVRDRDVALVGTGASAIQIVPEIAPLAKRFTLYQRTAAWVLPRGDRPVSSPRRAARRWIPGFARAERAAIYWAHEVRAYGFIANPRALQVAERVAAAHLKKQVSDPEVRAKLTPHYRLGCKRVVLSDDYYPALCLPNAEVADSPIVELRERSIVTQDGRERPADVAIFATGFAATDALGGVAISGAGGVELAHRWRDGMEAYLGTSVAGFPNLFTIVGPNTGLGHNSMILIMEAQYRYVLDALALLERRGARSVDVDAEEQARYNAGIQERLARAVWSSGCSSWYLDGAGKNTTLWPGYTFSFRAMTKRLREEHYRVR